MRIATVKRTTRTEKYEITNGQVENGTLCLTLATGELLWINHRDWVEVRYVERTEDD